jgi:hypothetical protein
MTESSETAHQRIMTEAYARWQSAEESSTGRAGDLSDVTSREDFLSALTELQQDAVVVGNFNYQSENGGLEQWVDNGYGADIGRLRCAIERVKKFVETNTVAYCHTGSLDDVTILKDVEKILVKLEPHLSDDEKSGWKNLQQRTSGYFWNTDEEEYRYDEDMPNDDEHPGQRIARKLTDDYYKINEKFMEICEKYFSANYDK